MGSRRGREIRGVAIESDWALVEAAVEVARETPRPCHVVAKRADPLNGSVDDDGVGVTSLIEGAIGNGRGGEGPRNVDVRTEKCLISGERAAGQGERATIKEEYAALLREAKRESMPQYAIRPRNLKTPMDGG